MRIAKISGLRDLLFAVHILLLCQRTAGQEKQDCNGVYIDRQCHTFGLNDLNWTVAEDKCAERYAISGYTGAHLTSIGSAQKQIEIEKFLDRFGLRGAWVGATNKPLIWQWVTNGQDLQAQGCYNDSRAFSYRAQITGYSTEGCIDACNMAGYGYAGIQNGSTCVCAHALDNRTLAVGCNSTCLGMTSLSKWCGGPNNLTTVYRIGGTKGAWGYNQPDMNPSKKSCAVLDMNLETKMADENCSMSYDYLCQMNMSTCSGPGYRKIFQLCYYVSNNSAVAWTTARDKCRNDFNGELAMVDNTLIELDLRKWFSSVFRGQNRKIWTGAFKGGWYWMAASSFGYMNWAVGEPRVSAEDQCLYIDQTLNYKWFALPCSQSKSFICQRGYDVFTTPPFNWIGPTPPIDTGSTGGTGGTDGKDCNGVYIDRQCHTFGLNDLNWTVAEDKCAERYAINGYTSAHLTSIGSAQKQRDIEHFLDRFGLKGAWVGATNKPLIWQWVTNGQDLQAQGCYNDSRAFSYRAQKTDLSTEGCIYACNIDGYGYAGIQNGSTCVCAHALDNRTMAVGCNSSCLVSTSLSKWCGGPNNLTTVYRIGGTKGAWGYNQPDMMPSQKSCAVLDMNLETKMADENCSMRYDYLCQQMNNSWCSGPGYSYQKVSQMCYYVSNNSAVGWTTARDKCRNDFNGELAMVDNNLIQYGLSQWLSTVFPGQNRKIWTGAFKGGWHWMAASSFGYMNWAVGEPRESAEDQCLFVDQTLNYKWLALPCSQSKAFICQQGYDLVTTPPFNWAGPKPPADIGNKGEKTQGTDDTDETSSTGRTRGTGNSVILLTGFILVTITVLL